jgi:SNF2 family DNA or RNA helicase
LLITFVPTYYVSSNQFDCPLSLFLSLSLCRGKTLQTATFVNFILSKLHRKSPALVIAPLSTLAHWKREFNSWTDLNVIVYHGNADDRKMIRELEFAYECDRPKGGVAFNQTFLKKCAPKRKDDQSSSPWMVQVVITTPETMVCDDSNEMMAVHWEVVVVDEAHRLKNNNSKLTMKLKDPGFSFNHKALLTGTPIQNNVQEFWTLLNFIDPDAFGSMNDFMDKYGDLKSKERVDELHEEIRPYILRRLKEDVEKSVPPKEEQLIEVELTIAQKQYYRALYEKNVGFLYKNKKALDGPSLNNLAMQLRKCCNHLFLLNGVELAFRHSLVKAGENLMEGDLLVRASGKLVLLDKLLPRLREQGHRVLLFTQFKIMLDILEDYFHARQMKFERVRSVNDSVIGGIS